MEKSVEDIRAEVRADENTQNMFNGLHRFLKDDISVLKNELSKNQQNKLSKQLAHGDLSLDLVVGISYVAKVSKYIEAIYHPYPKTHHKFGVKLVAGNDKWGTPWHNVTVEKDGQFQLMKKREALALGATPKLFKDYYAYYQL